MKTKTCNSCSKTKSINKFPKNRSLICKDCGNAAWRSNYNNDKKYRINKQKTTRAYVKARRKEFQIKILKLLVASGCVDCGEKDPIVLEFDHVKGKKIAGVSAMIRITSNWEVIQREIDKCEARCANCHRRKTSKTHGWYADIDLSGL